MVPIAFWMTKRMAKGSGEAWGAYRYDYGHYESWLHGSISNWKEIKVLNQQNNQLEKLESEWGKLRSNFYKGCLYFFINRSFIGFSDFFITKMNLYFVGGILIFNGYLKIGLLFVFIKYYEKFFACVNGLTHADMRIVEYMPKVNRVLEILRMRIKDEHRGKSISETDIQFKNVCFRYEGGDKNVINNLNLSVANKQCISLVGDSGNGKTTLIKLLLGLYDEYSGEILIGDTELREISVDELHTKVAVVMQDSILFNDTIINNMKIVKPDATQSEIMDACKKANIHKEISEMAEGYYTIIGEKGIQLSGGQKQRLAIARALLMKPKIIVFDEATSALDSESEQAINKTIRALKGTTTVLIIAHRLSSIIISDKIAVLKDSRIVEQGEFSELSRNGKEFKELFAGQMQLM